MNSLAVTRPNGEGANTAAQIRERGWRPLIVHTVQLKPRPVEQVSDELKKEITTGTPDWIVFMSPRSTGMFFEAANQQDGLKRTISERSRFIAVGPKTKSSLKQTGAKTVDIPRDYSSEGIAEFFSKTQARGKRILLARSNQASDLLEEQLKALGAVVSTLRLYDSSLPSDERSVSEFLRELKAGNVNATLFTSALSAANLFIMSEPHLDAMELRKLLRNTLVGAIGPVTSERLIILGVNPDLVPERFLIEEGIANIIDAVETRAHAVSQ